MFDPEQEICRLAADLVLATQAHVDAENTCADTANTAAALERSLVSLAEEVYAMEFDLYADSVAGPDGDKRTVQTADAIHALAAEFLASLVQMKDGEPQLTTSVLLGNTFDALSDALSRAGYLGPQCALRVSRPQGS